MGKRNERIVVYPGTFDPITMGHLDIIIIRLFARLRGAPVIWDAFLSLYDTVVHDRGHLTFLDHPAVLAIAEKYPGRPGLKPEPRSF